MKLSVIICTLNPRPDYFQRVLDALNDQTLPKEEWELLVIDNASTTALAPIWNLSWHPHARHVRENEPGLTFARLRGIKESNGEILVFVDDDNVLLPDYLINGLEIAGKYPFIGAWAGQVDGEFETPLSQELNPFYGCLALADVAADRWSNSYETPNATPYGAGMCVRRDVAVAYLEACEADSRKQTLDRVGTVLAGAGDIDLAYTALDKGYGMGRFRALRLIHLIPHSRVQPEYLERLTEGGQLSTMLLHYMRNMPVQLYIPRRDYIKFWLDYYAQTPGYRRLMLAQKRGKVAARKIILQDQMSAEA